MKVRILRSKEYVAAQRVATGENVTDRIVVDISPAALGEEMRRAIITHNGVYPEALGLCVDERGRLMLDCQFSDKAYEMQADVEISDATPALVERLFMAKLEQAKIDAEEKKAKALEYEQARARKREEEAKHKAWREAEQARIKAEREAVEDLLESRRTAQIEAWIQQYGTPSQRGRHARGLLDQDEVLDDMRAKIFQPLEGFPRYRKIELQEVLKSYRDAGFDYYEGTLVVNVESDPHLSEEEFEKLQALEAALPAAESKVRIHRGLLNQSSEEEDAIAAVERVSVLMTVTVGDLQFSREYAL